MAVVIKRYQNQTLPTALYALYEDILANTPASWSGIATPSNGVLSVIPTGYLEKIIEVRVGSANVEGFGLMDFVSKFVNSIASGETIAQKNEFFNTLPVDRIYGYSGYGWTFEVNDNT